MAQENRPPGAPIQYNHHQPSVAHVETYQTTTTMTKDLRRPSQQMDSSLSVTPTATSPQHSIISNAHEAGRAHVHQDDRSLVNSGKCENREFVITLISVCSLSSIRIMVFLALNKFHVKWISNIDILRYFLYHLSKVLRFVYSHHSHYTLSYFMS